ncbi:L-threonylcarbamoyladenylate synthase [Mucisphaera sp.]|uniref:L-threonylcarbamoyladenylate synthase n=1 Tax=Mucisphaera sp. TaxID=2913024 RepID=UPI003D14ED8D
MSPSRIQPPKTESLAQATRLLRDAQTVAIPTETVYGLAADALNPEAVARIFAIKNRPRFDPLIVHIHTADTAPDLAADWPDTAQQLADAFWPGPLTLVLPKKPLVPDIVTAGTPTVALRCPDHPVPRELIQRIGPLAAPSANRFTGISPTTAQHVADELPDKPTLILDAGPTTTGLESTVISLATTQPTLLRPGGLSIETIEAITGPLQRPSPSDNPATPQSAPGQSPRHYAPRTPVLLYIDQPPTPDAIRQASRPPDPTTAREKGGQKVGGAKVGGAALLTLTPDPDAENAHPWTTTRCLSPESDLNLAATRLFAALRELDSLQLDLIVAQTTSQSTGIAPAIADRLRRASHPTV